MSDGFYAGIKIGGRLPKKYLGEFLQVLQKEGIPDAPRTEADLRKTLNEEDASYLDLSDSEASYGCFKDLEIYCMKRSLTFQRNSESYGEYDAKEVYWVPGMNEPHVNTTDADSHPVIRVDEMLEIMNDIKKFIKKVPTIDNAPLHINDSDPRHCAYAERILKQHVVDPMDLLEMTIKAEYPEAGEMPPLEII